MVVSKIKSPLSLLDELDKEVCYEQSSSRKIKSPSLLLNEFGEAGWYRPITEQNSSKQWYIRIHSVCGHDYIGIGEARRIDERKIR
jgi:hypothetical protein